MQRPTPTAMTKLQEIQVSPSRPNPRRRRVCLPVTLVALGVVWAILYAFNLRLEFHVNVAVRDKSRPKAALLREKLTCRAPLPQLLASNPPGSDAPELKAAAADLHSFLSLRTSAPDIDSLSIAVVTPAGPIFEHGYGVLRANESALESRGSVTRDSIYRIASITKMFAVLETLILRERGVLSWDDPVTKFFPNFTHPSYGWQEYLNGKDDASSDSPITLRQLASHLSGIGRDYPPSDVGLPWPRPLDLNAVGNDTEIPDVSTREFLDAIAKYPLVAPQYTFPIYSNTGMDLLGLCNVAANTLATGKERTYRELMQDDIFAPLGLKHSFYEIPNQHLGAQMAVPASNSFIADLVFPTVNEASGGQYSSLADLTKVMQSFLSPNNNGVVSSYVMREWLRPLHPWSDGFYEVGAPWEITKVGGEGRIYSKGGNLPGYHSQFGLNMDMSYGVIVLLTGNYTDTAHLAREAINRFHPAFEKLLLNQAFQNYAGIWTGNNNSLAIVTIQDRALYLTSLTVGDSDVLSILQGKPQGTSLGMALWSTGRPHEFRLAIGRSELNDDPEAGCEPYWISLDYPMARGAPLDLLFWDGSELVYPSAEVRLRKWS
ncbi:beta-lactamase domain-containing protein [Favolaschia claudopus]|uniref:Beta-lactamase domain-containing protein n=1 Tax=Favolaschia claudopus TaxID=2862362 RepID=A0AAW0EJ25_9AGAR